MSHGPEPTAIGLTLSTGTSFHEWRAIVKRLGDLANGSTWALADAVYFGSRAFAKPFGQRYSEALAATRLDYQTLKNLAYVAGRFPIERRRPRLSFKHHAEVAALESSEQDRFLELAERRRWSTRELRLEIARSRVRPAGSEARRPAEPSAGREASGPKQLALDERDVLRLTVPMPLVREQRWKAAAHTRGLSLADWLVDVADEAAGMSSELRLTG